MGDAPAQGRVDVGAFGAGQVEVLALLWPARFGVRPVGRVREPLRVGGRRHVGQPGLVEAFSRQRADAVEQAVADRAARAELGGGQGAVHEPGDDVEAGIRRHLQGRQHRFDGREGGAPGEGGDGPQATLVVGEEKVVAPGQRGPQGGLARWQVAGRIAQQREPVVQAAGDLVDRKHPRAGGRELDRQG